MANRPTPPSRAGEEGQGSPATEVAEVLSEWPGSEPSPWMLVVSDTTPGRHRVHESLLTVADGTTGTRGSLEEGGIDSLPGVYMAGVYEHREDGSEAILAIPTWITLSLRAPLPAGTRVLDLRSGVLWRTVNAKGGPILFSARWACLEHPGTMVLVAEGRSTIFEPAGPESVTDRATFGDHVAVVVHTRRQAQPARAERSRTIGIVRHASYERADQEMQGTARPDPAPGPGAVVDARSLLAEQKSAWASRWAEADIEVVGDVELTRAFRLALFHLMASVGDSGEAAVGPRGLTGPAYGGHVFWDSDVFVLPVMAATHPASARAILEYRVRRLSAAMDQASSLGRSGARFPWESASLGYDVTPKSGIDDRGHVSAIRTGELEEHITADVAWAAWQVAAWSGRWSFLEGPGRPLMTETARYWASRIRLDSDGVGHIDGVIGPDEYHEHVDDNAFTNLMAAWNLERAADLVERGSSATELVEAQRWRSLSRAIVDGFDAATGRYVQFAGFDDLEPLLVDDIGPIPVLADLVLGHDRVAGSQIIKQADVLMAHHMIPGALRRGTLRRDLDHYLPRTAHGSSLSPGVHAAVLARAGRLKEALGFLQLAQDIDLDDVTGSTAGGLHLASLGGLWQALVFGFAGVRVTGPDDGALVLDPHIPSGWDELRITLHWHGRRVRLRCQGNSVHVACASSVRVQLGEDAPVLITPPGAWIEPKTKRARRGRLAPEVDH